eukprot:gene8835-11926_t
MQYYIVWLAIIINYCFTSSITGCIVSITAFNTFGNGVDYDDEALFRAIQKCKDGGRIVIPPGRYLLSPFTLLSNIELHLEHDAELIATNDTLRWPIISNYPSYPPTGNGNMRVGPFIGGVGITNVSITGFGKINGQGSAWWDSANLPFGRPRLIEPMDCSYFSIVGITIIDPPFWAVHPYNCNNLLFENIIYSAPVQSPNTDGIDPDSCSNVIIRNFTVISCGDDAIAIKSGKNEEGRTFGKPSHDILIEGGRIGPSSGINIGSEMSGDVYNVIVRDVRFTGSLFTTRIKSARGRGGKVFNVTFEDLSLDYAIMGLAINLKYGDGNASTPASDTTPHIDNINYRRIKGSATTAGAFICLPESVCRGITMEDVIISSTIGGFECFRVSGNSTGTVKPPSCF